MEDTTLYSGEPVCAHMHGRRELCNAVRGTFLLCTLAHARRAACLCGGQGVVTLCMGARKHAVMFPLHAHVLCRFSNGAAAAFLLSCDVMARPDAWPGRRLKVRTVMVCACVCKCVCAWSGPTTRTYSLQYNICLMHGLGVIAVYGQCVAMHQ